MRNRFVFASFALAISIASTAFADVFVDNDAGAPGYTETGTWQSTASVGLGYNGGGYRFTQSTAPPSTATWTPTIPATGYYEVYSIFRRGANRSGAVPHAINHADGTANVLVDQTDSFEGGLGEQLLGSYRFLAGTSGNVVMSNVAGGSVVFIADTIRFAPDAPPVISQARHVPLYPQASQPLTALALVEDGGSIVLAEVDWSASPSGTSGTATAFDDGAHDDGAAGDGVFGASLPGFPDGEIVTFSFEATDNAGGTTVGDDVVVEIGLEADFDVRINEVLASNGGSILDPDFGDSSDWIELLNLGPDTADLTGYTLSDDSEDPEKWAFPAGTTIPAGGYLLVWCDDRNVALDDLHSNFRLGAGGEDAVLYDTSHSAVVDSTTYPALGSDESWSRFPNGTGSFAHTIVTTPLAENLLEARGDAPAFSHPSGLYSSAISVAITAPGASEIRYTTDGSEPEATSTLYSVPLNISSMTGLRARAWYPSASPSLTATASYFYGLPADRTIPVVNMIIDPDHLFDPVTGIHSNPNNHGELWERPGHAVFMNPDGTEVHSSGVGVRINGGTSRGANKKSFRFYLRANYGNPSWSLPWLERTTASSFDNLVLRANNNDGILNASSTQLAQVTFFRDEILRDWHGDMGAISVDGFFCALYINGEYRGLYNACERVKNEYMQEKAGGADWDIMKGTWNSTQKYNTEVADGDATEWNAFLSWLDASDLTSQADFDELKQRIDYPQFLDWFALNICAQNEDWPQNNWIATKRRGDPTAKWTFHQNDGEWGLGLRPQGYTSDTILWAQGQNFHLSSGHNNTIAPLCKLFNGNNLQTNRTFDVDGILDNPQGVKEFAAAIEEVLNFELRPSTAIASVDAYAAKIQTEVPRESARWIPGTAASFNAGWPTAVSTMRTFLTNRPAHIRGLMQSKFGIAGVRTITFQKGGAGNGRMEIYGRTVDLPWTGIFFDASTLHLSALPDEGSSFAGWSGAFADPDLDVEYAVTAGGDLVATLTFGVAPSSVQPNDVIFNEYWVNDNVTDYASVSGAMEGDWFELLVVADGTDLRGWRVTNNPTKTEQGAVDDGNGSLIFPDSTAISDLRSGTFVLVVSSTNTTNDATFAADDLDASDRRLVFYRANGNLDDATDPGFGIGNNNEAIVLLAPGPTASFADDIGVDFIAEGSTVTPATFFAGASGVLFPTPFSGIGSNDGAFFTNSTGGGFDNDDGSDPNNSDAAPGPGGWVVDPPATATGDDTVVTTNVLTPGAVNTGQNIGALIDAAEEQWLLY